MPTPDWSPFEPLKGVSVLLKYILPGYILKEVLRTFIPAFFGFVCLIVLGLTIQLLHKGLDIVDIRTIIPYLMLFACPDAMPVSFLAATVMSFGRLSANSEIVAIRTSGVHLYVIITPIIIVGFLLTFLTLYLNAEVLPAANKKIKLLKETAVSSILSRRISTVKKKIIFEPYHIYIGTVEDNSYRNLAIIEYYKDYVINILLADEGTIVMSGDEESLVVTLRDGDFAKMNYRKPAEVPMVGTFGEMSLEIPLNKKVVTSSKKYKTLSELYRDRSAMVAKLEKYPAAHNRGDRRSFARDAKRELEAFRMQYAGLTERHKDALRDKGILDGRVSRNKAKLENIANEIDTVDNRIAIANVGRIYLEEGGEVQGNQHDNSDNSDGSVESYLQIKELKNKEFLALQDSIAVSIGELDAVNNKAADLKRQIAELEKGNTDLALYAEYNKIQERADSFLTLIHKRVSSSFLCVTFILIGIPIGLLTKSGNVLISFGVSFLLVILVYYPLSVIGLVLSNGLLPIGPSVWGANGVMIAMGLVLFRRSLAR